MLLVHKIRKQFYARILRISYFKYFQISGKKFRPIIILPKTTLRNVLQEQKVQTCFRPPLSGQISNSRRKTPATISHRPRFSFESSSTASTLILQSPKRSLERTKSCLKKFTLRDMFNGKSQISLSKRVSFNLDQNTVQIQSTTANTSMNSANFENLYSSDSPLPLHYYKEKILRVKSQSFSIQSPQRSQLTRFQIKKLDHEDRKFSRSPLIKSKK